MGSSSSATSNEIRVVRAGNPDALEQRLVFHRADGFQVIETVRDEEGVYVSKLEKIEARPEVKPAEATAEAEQPPAARRRKKE